MAKRAGTSQIRNGHARLALGRWRPPPTCRARGARTFGSGSANLNRPADRHAMLLSERLKKRHDHWYRTVAPWWRKDSNPIHRAMEFRAVMNSDAPDEAWRCCRFWQRKLFNKWNIREFSRRHGCRVPELYWHGRDVGEIDFNGLPTHFVIRATRGSQRKNTLAMANGVNLLDNRPYGTDQLQQQCRQLLARMKRRPSSQLLIEEFAASESGELVLPVDYRVHVFGGRVGAICASDITDAIRSDGEAQVDRRRVLEGSFTEQ